jgi:hypothetical protein
MKSAPIFLVTLFACSFLHAQDTTQAAAQETIESILTNDTDEKDLQQLVDELEYLQQHPINIREPNYNDLMRLTFVSPMLAEAIVLFADTVVITSTTQLLEIELMTEELYKKLLPFITIREDDSQSFFSLVQPQKAESRTRYERRLQLPRGYITHTYRGDIHSTYQRLRVGNDHVELGGLFEKDAGELYHDGFTAGYLSVRNISPVRQFVVGNFTVTSGQGLIFSKNIAATKGSNVIGQIQKRGSVISPSVSTDEYRYFQGFASMIDIDHVSVVGFYSNRDIPATVNASGVVTSFFTSGAYRTMNDLARKNALRENVSGGLVRYMLDPVKSISLTLVKAEYNKQLSPSLFELREGKSISAGSVSWELPFTSMNIFGEIASNNGESFSKIFGLIIPAAKNTAFSYHHRSYTKGVVSPFARPFGEREIISDGEVGNYIGLHFAIGTVKVNSYVDVFTLPATSNQFETNGREVFVHCTFSPVKNVDLLFHVRDRERMSTFVRGFDDQRRQTNYRCAYTIQATRQFVFTQRLEIVNVSYAPSDYREKGFLTFAEVTYKESNLGVDLKSRFVLFDTDSYDSRLYQYESDVAGNFSNPPLYGKGIRWYLIAGYELFSMFRISMKYAETKRLYETVLGSGNDEIIGNLDNYIALQVDFKI